jgi:hypothetical protein
VGIGDLREVQPKLLAEKPEYREVEMAFKRIKGKSNTVQESA